MANRQRDSRKEQLWRRRILRWQQSQRSVRAFCTAEGFSEHTFYWWRRELRRRDASAPSHRPAPPPTFLPVRIVADRAAAAIEVVLGNGRLVRLAPGFDPDLLRQLLPVLEEPSC